MLNAQSFIACVADNLKSKGFGQKRIDEIISRVEGLKQGYISEGHSAADAETLAATRALNEVAHEKAERAKRTLQAIFKNADHNARVDQAINGDVDTSVIVLDKADKSGGVAVARAAISLIEDDPRFQGDNYSANKETTRGVLYSMLADVLNKVGKGAFGRQKGKAHLPNIVRELFGDNTGDLVAKEFAQAYNKVIDQAVHMFNNAGGSMRRLADYRLPQGQSAARLIKKGEADWIEKHKRALDWAAMRWPDGSPIAVGDQDRILVEVYKTISTNGAHSLDSKALRGQGAALGNAMDQHRFLVYKDAQSWLETHEAFGDGNPFEIIMQHIDDMSHKIAMLQTFGPNPDLARRNLHNIVRKKASKLGGEAVAAAEAEMKNTFDPMFDIVTRQNPMDPNSIMGNLVTGAGNLLTSAWIGSASLLAVPGDFMQTFNVRALNNMDLFGGVDFYLKSMVGDTKFQQTISAQSGFVMDEVVMSIYAAQRFTGLATIGPAWTQRLSDWTVRASLLSPHTRSLRWGAQAEFMGFMERSRSIDFDALPFKAVMERYGITRNDWDTLRNNVKAWQPRRDVNFMRPIDILESNAPNKEQIYRKFQGMILEESRKMVPETTVEGTATLRDTTRPDTLVGALMYSFSMFKNFPVSFLMIYGRLALSRPEKMTRLKFVASLGASMVLVGALGTQLREISKGRDPLPMDTPEFFGKALLSGGALSIWGDFLFAGVNEYGRGPADLVGGPVVNALGDATNLAFGDTFKWASTIGALGDPDFESNAGADAVQFARRYFPGSSVWWARLVIERQAFDRLQEIADPQVYRKRQQRERRQERDFGNKFWWGAGDRTPERAPDFEGAIGQ